MRQTTKRLSQAERYFLALKALCLYVWRGRVPLQIKQGAKQKYTFF